MTLSLRDVKRSLTEQTIAEKAAVLFKEHGFAQVSVRQIAKAALVSEKTVFNYFPYKELIVLAGAQPLGLLTVASMLPTSWEKRLIASFAS